MAQKAKKNQKKQTIKQGQIKTQIMRNHAAQTHFVF